MPVDRSLGIGPRIHSVPLAIASAMRSSMRQTCLRAHSCVVISEEFR